MARKLTIAGLQREKEELERKVAYQADIIKQQDADDLKVRTELSELLGSYKIKYENNYGMHREEGTKEVEVQSWIGIAFLIGELKADANYAMVLEARDRFRDESRSKDQIIDRMRQAMLLAGVEFDFNGEEYV